jgi:hypothetical protein
MSSTEPVIAQSNLSPTSNQQGTAVQARLFKIIDIPAAMDAMGWSVSAALMRHWFQGAPWPTANGGMAEQVKDHIEFPPEQYIEESIVKMSWVTSFDSVSPVLDELREKWNSTNATALTHERLLKAYGDKDLGRYNLAFSLASEAEHLYLNSLAINFPQWSGGELNDLRGALANFNLRVTAEGEVSVYTDRIVFQPRTLLFYAEDNYDFNDDDSVFSQPLGYWNFDGIAPSVLEAITHNTGVDAVSTSIIHQSMFGMSQENERRYMDEQSKRYMLVLNSHFAAYRDKYQRGGDFRIYSDLLREPLPASTAAITVPRP